MKRAIRPALTLADSAHLIVLSAAPKALSRFTTRAKRRGPPELRTGLRPLQAGLRPKAAGHVVRAAYREVAVSRPGLRTFIVVSCCGKPDGWKRRWRNSRRPPKLTLQRHCQAGNASHPADDRSRPRRTPQSAVNRRCRPAYWKRRLQQAGGPVELGAIPMFRSTEGDRRQQNHYETIGKLAGINVLFDPDYTSRRIKVESQLGFARRSAADRRAGIENILAPGNAEHDFYCGGQSGQA